MDDCDLLVHISQEKVTNHYKFIQEVPISPYLARSGRLRHLLQSLLQVQSFQLLLHKTTPQKGQGPRQNKKIDLHFGPTIPSRHHPSVRGFRRLQLNLHGYGVK